MVEEPALRQRLLTMSSGGWVLVLSGFLTMALVLWAVAPALFGTASRPAGNGRDLDSYRFDLTNLQVPRKLVIPAMRHRDMVHPMSGPGLIAGGEMDELNSSRGKFVLGSDRVIGVVIDGEARAYPISVLNVHEVIHDTLAGRQIAVTYHWPCDSAVVFDREIGDRVIEFGVSGLLYNSNQLLYERRPGSEPGGEALWSQMLGRAVSGPAAGERLTTIPCQVVSWRRWFEQHPETTVSDRDPSIVKKRYAKSNPEQYFRDGRVEFPISPEPPADGPRPLTPVVAVEAGGQRLVYPYPFIEAKIDADGVWTTNLGGVRLTFQYDVPSSTVEVTADGVAQFEHAAWFAWHAMHPDDPLAE
jgi:hypothetical protein